jgi:hypothetical protein
MKTNLYFICLFGFSVLLVACNGGSNKKDKSPVAEVKNIVDSIVKKDEGISKQESSKRTPSEGITNFLKTSSYDYVLDFSDPTTYSITCGKINPGQWSVKNDTCSLYTSYIMADVSGSADVEFTFSVNQSGNGDVYDKGYVYHAIDGGAWEADTVWTAGGAPAVYELKTTVSLEYGHYVQFSVKLATNDKTEFWAIFDGGIHATDGDDSNNNIHAYQTKPGSGLPVALVQFTGTSENGNAILNWSTASEINNDYFIVEKSPDGVMFSAIAKIDGAGNSNNILSYEYIDKDPSDLNYYRLKQYDFDGATSYSDIIKVSLSEAGKNLVQVSCAQGTLYIRVNSTSDGLMKVKIYNLSGAVVFESEYAVEKGSSTHTIIPSIIKKSIYIISTSLNKQLPVNSKIYFE